MLSFNTILVFINLFMKFCIKYYGILYVPLQANNFYINLYIDNINNHDVLKHNIQKYN